MPNVCAPSNNKINLLKYQKHQIGMKRNNLKTENKNVHKLMHELEKSSRKWQSSNFKQDNYN